MNAPTSPRWTDRTVLVTGSTGIVGSRLVERLVELGASVVCFVRDHDPASALWTGGVIDRVAVAMAGRIGEKLVTNDISNGAASDIKMATNTARAMVCDYGMSDLGPIALGDNQDTVFLGRDITRSQHVSEDTARRIDLAVSEILNGQYQRAQKIIGEHREALDKIANALLEYETIEGKHVLEILKEGEIKSPVVTVRPPKLPPSDSARPAGKPAPEASGPTGAPAPSPA